MSNIAKRLSAAMTAFTKIGRQNGSAPPDTDSNTLGLVYEMYISDRLASAATARKDAARAAAFDAGIIADDYTPGDHTPYTSDMLNVNVKRHENSTTLDKTMLKNWLTTKYGVGVADEAIKAASKPRKGNTIISVSVVG